ncbi:MAG: tetratricopeptide repeat protein [Desulfobacteraceae bacterium]|nr:tetratricopeptide repeat protein [Desulfobacteraceae bacterium]
MNFLPFLRIYLYLFVPVFLLTFVVSVLCNVDLGFMGIVLVALVLNTIPTSLVLWFSDKVGQRVSSLYRGTQQQSPEDQYSGNLSRARFLRGKGRYDEALGVIDEYLGKVPGAKEALFLKAQTLIDSSGDLNQARACLDAIQKTVPPEDSYYRWAKELRSSIRRPQ